MGVSEPVPAAPQADAPRQQTVVTKAHKEGNPEMSIKLIKNNATGRDLNRVKVPLSKTPGQGLWRSSESENETISQSSTESPSSSPFWDKACPEQPTRVSSKTQAPQALVIDLRQSDTDETKGTSVSDAISDTSFTPPKSLGKCARIDEQGRRHVLAPPGCREASPPPKNTRFTFLDRQKGTKFLVAPPGYHHILPREIEEEPQKRETVSFERKENYGKSEVTCGGIAQAVQESQQRPMTSRKIRFGVEPPKQASNGRQAVARRQNVHLELTPPSSPPSSSPPPPPSIGRAVAGWTSEFHRKVFEAENDLVFDGRWPASTF
ncbi:hypothetical protein ONZ43_g7129 [Nemania bipapillata]|uniref:Uncharacterized protein n=1 Tax=Nemania bipapillata TaxID=110536 RepID=A0ACC2HU25_9PEZI|nr:hypothetical protein ONZ43_g7129 [Nemania bipapillata]